MSGNEKEGMTMPRKLMILLLAIFVITPAFNGCLGPEEGEPTDEDENTAPILGALDTVYDHLEGVGLAWTLTLTAEDAEEDTLTFTMGTAPAGAAMTTAGVISYTPTAAGSFDFTVTVSDGELTDSASFALTVTAVTVTNNPPTITGVNDAYTLTDGVGTEWTIDVIGADADSDALLYGLTEKPTGAVISATGSITWTPAAAGTFDFTVEVSDNIDSVTKDFTVTVTDVTTDPVNNVPTVTGVDATYDITVGQAWTIDVLGADADDDALLYGLTEKPTGATISATGTITWTPTTAGTFPFVVAVSDNVDSIEVSFNVTTTDPLPVNTAPVVTTEDLTLTVGDLFTYTVMATDADDDTLTFSLISGPAGVTIDQFTGEFSWLPIADDIGDMDIVVMVDDGEDTVTATLGITVEVPEIDVPDEGDIDVPPVEVDTDIPEDADELKEKALDLDTSSAEDNSFVSLLASGAGVTVTEDEYSTLLGEVDVDEPEEIYEEAEDESDLLVFEGTDGFIEATEVTDASFALDNPVDPDSYTSDAEVPVDGGTRTGPSPPGTKQWQNSTSADGTRTVVKWFTYLANLDANSDGNNERLTIRELNDTFHDMDLDGTPERHFRNWSEMDIKDLNDDGNKERFWHTQAKYYAEDLDEDGTPEYVRTELTIIKVNDTADNGNVTSWGFSKTDEERVNGTTGAVWNSTSIQSHSLRDPNSDGIKELEEFWLNNQTRTDADGDGTFDESTAVVGAWKKVDQDSDGTPNREESYAQEYNMTHSLVNDTWHNTSRVIGTESGDIDDNGVWDRKTFYLEQYDLWDLDGNGQPDRYIHVKHGNVSFDNDTDGISEYTSQFGQSMEVNASTEGVNQYVAMMNTGEEMRINANGTIKKASIVNSTQGFDNDTDGNMSFYNSFTYIEDKVYNDTYEFVNVVHASGTKFLDDNSDGNIDMYEESSGFDKKVDWDRDGVFDLFSTYHNSAKSYDNDTNGLPDYIQGYTYAKKISDPNSDGIPNSVEEFTQANFVADTDMDGTLDSVLNGSSFKRTVNNNVDAFPEIVREFNEHHEMHANASDLFFSKNFTIGKEMKDLDSNGVAEVTREIVSYEEFRWNDTRQGIDYFKNGTMTKTVREGLEVEQHGGRELYDNDTDGVIEMEKHIKVGKRRIDVGVDGTFDREATHFEGMEMERLADNTTSMRKVYSFTSIREFGDNETIVSERTHGTGSEGIMTGAGWNETRMVVHQHMIDNNTDGVFEYNATTIVGNETHDRDGSGARDHFKHYVWHSVYQDSDGDNVSDYHREHGAANETFFNSTELDTPTEVMGYVGKKVTLDEDGDGVYEVESELKFVGFSKQDLDLDGTLETVNHFKVDNTAEA